MATKYTINDFYPENRVREEFGRWEGIVEAKTAQKICVKKTSEEGFEWVLPGEIYPIEKSKKAEEKINKAEINRKLSYLG